MIEREKYPSIFAEGPSPLVSPKYQFIKTSDVLESLSEIGWTPREMSEVRARKPHTIGFQKHLIRLTNPGWSPIREIGDEVPEIILTNSHNGKNSFSFRVGIYRMVCSNGLVIPTEELTNVTIKHFGSMKSQIEEAVERMTSTFPSIYEDIQRMKNKELNSSQISSFSREAIKARSLTLEKSSPSGYQEILLVQRPEDDGNSLWKTYNRIQENLTEGNLQIGTRKGNRKASPVKSIDKGIKMNEGLWTLAKSYL